MFMKLKRGIAMIGMQYKVMLPSDYDMNIIRKRVKENGAKTDRFQGLHFKAYLITENGNDNNIYNSYSPLYIWNSHSGMNTFLFEGYYDNILKSFGWQRINIGIPLYCKLNKNFPDSLYAIEITGSIQETTSLAASLMENQPSLELKNEIVGETCIYNPDKWCYSHICFFREKPENLQNIGTMYEVLHVSIGE